MRRPGHSRLQASAATRLALTFVVLSSAAVLARAQSAGPASVAIVVDNSSSMTGSGGGKRLRAALQRLVESEDIGNEYFVFGVSTDVSIETSDTAGVLDAPAASKALGSVFSMKKEGATALFDACALAAVRLANGRHPRRHILVISDGGDTISNVTFADVENLLKRLGVRLSAVGIPSRDIKGGDWTGGVEKLEKLAAASGGSVYRLKGDAKEDALYEAVKALLAPGAQTR